MSSTFINLRRKASKYLHTWPYRREMFPECWVVWSKGFPYFYTCYIHTQQALKCCDSPLLFGRPVLYNLSGKMERLPEFLMVLCQPCLFHEHLYMAESANLRHFSLVPTRPKGRQRKLWKDEGRWEHDKFREDEQAPKSRQELIALYGYDIRSAHNPDDIKPRRIRKPRWGHFGAYIIDICKKKKKTLLF